MQIIYICVNAVRKMNIVPNVEPKTLSQWVQIIENKINGFNYTNINKIKYKILFTNLMNFKKRGVQVHTLTTI